MTNRRPYDHLKRLIDVVGAAVLLVVLSPVVLGVAVAVRATLGRPVLFRQPRPGINGEIFTLIKFRTMRHGEAPDGERITSFGRLLRSTSLDELPELVHVLQGRMSLVGPRPLLVEYLPKYTDRQARRHEVRPGMTGLAQVSGRNGLAWEERLELDVRYVETRSLRLDASILIATLRDVVTRRGVAAPGHDTSPRFDPMEVE